jgi:hypothetical protein
MRSAVLFSSQERKNHNESGDLNFKCLVDQEKGLSRLKLAKELSLLPRNLPQVIKLLLEAIELGSQEAGNYLTKIILKNCEIGIDMDLTSVLVQLEKMQAINPIAAYALGEIHAGILHPTTKHLLPILSDEKETSTRQEKAIGYLNTAITQGNDKARVFLSTAFVRGKGCIVSDEKRWIELNKRLADQGNQACAFDYAAYLNLSTVSSAHNRAEYLNYLLIATHGNNWTTAYKALEKICIHFKNEAAFLKEKGISLLELLHKEAHTGNQFISFYLAYCFSPKEILPVVDTRLHPPALLHELLSKTERSIEQTVHYLSLAISGSNQGVCNVANLFKEKLNLNHRASVSVK